MLGREIMSLEHELQDMDPLSALVRGLADMRRFRGLHQAMHHRMVESEPVRESHERFLGWIRSMVDEVVGTTSQQEDKRMVQQEDKRMVSDIVVSIFEGANVTEPPLRPAPEMIRYLLRSLVPSDS